MPSLGFLTWEMGGGENSSSTGGYEAPPSTVSAWHVVHVQPSTVALTFSLHGLLKDRGPGPQSTFSHLLKLSISLCSSKIAPEARPNYSQVPGQRGLTSMTPQLSTELRSSPSAPQPLSLTLTLCSMQVCLLTTPPPTPSTQSDPDLGI